MATRARVGKLSPKPSLEAVTLFYHRNWIELEQDRWMDVEHCVSRVSSYSP